VTFSFICSKVYSNPFRVLLPTGTYSQWGSWALLETQTQATNISYKYQAFIETVAAQNNPQASAATTLLPLFWLLLICAALFFLL